MKIKVARIHLPDEHLQTTRVRGIGFRATCECGWQSRIKRSYSDARSEQRAHKEWHDHAGRAPLAGPV